MPRKATRRTNGSVRKLPSGRYQARILNPVTGKHVSIGTFRTKGEADAALAAHSTDKRRGSWVDPRRGDMTLTIYCNQWMRGRVDLRPRTRELYEGHLGNHILPVLGSMKLGDLTTPVIKSWHAELQRAGKPGENTLAKVYRLLSTILRSAVEDERIVKNPAKLKRAGVERSAERPIATIEQIHRLADAIGDEWQAAIFLGAFMCLRLEEVRGLRRHNINLLHRRLTIEGQVRRTATETCGSVLRRPTPVADPWTFRRKSFQIWNTISRTSPTPTPTPGCSAVGQLRSAGPFSIPRGARRRRRPDLQACGFMTFITPG